MVRRDLSVGLFTGWGALAGIAVGLFAVLAFGAGLPFIGIAAVACAVSAAASLQLARTAEARDLLELGAERPPLEGGRDALLLGDER